MRTEGGSVSNSIETHTCPYCPLVFMYHEEIRDHILYDHPDHWSVAATMEVHELPHG